MPTLNIQGQRVKVSDDFLKLSPEEQNATVEEIAGKLGVKPAAAPAEDAVKTGDWDAVKQRVDAKQAALLPDNMQGPVRQQDVDAIRQGEARKQGALYGKSYGQNESGGEVFGRQAANTAGLGLPQLMEAYMPKWLGGQSALPGAEAHEFIKSADAARGEESPIANAAGVIAGIGGQIAAMPGGIPSVGGKVLGATGGRIAGSAAVGAGMGGAEGAITSRGDLGQTAQGAGAGALGGAAGGALGEYVGSKLATRAANKAAADLAPSTEDLGRLAAQKYAEAKDAGVWYAPKAYKGLVDDIKSTLSEAGVDETLHPAVTRAVARLEAEGGNAVTLDKLDILRRVASSAAKSKQPDEGRLGRMIIDKLDDFVDSPGDGAVIFGNGPQGGKALVDARAAYAAKSRADRIEQAFQDAKDAAGTSGAGFNVDNAIRQAAKRLLKTDSRGFSPDEIAALREVARGTLTRNALRLAGKAAPNGAVSTGISAGAGFAVGGPLGGLAAPAIGYGAKKLADRGTQKALENVSAMTRARVVPGATEAIANAKLPKNQSGARLLMSLIGINTGLGASQLANQ